MKFQDLLRRGHTMSSPAVQIYDPRRGTPFTFAPLPSGKLISVENHVVLRVRPEFDILNSKNSRLLSAIPHSLETGLGHGFAIACGAPKALEKHIGQLDHPSQIDDSIFGYFEATSSGFAKHCQLFLSLSYGALLLGNIDCILNAPSSVEELREWRRLRNEFRIDVFAALHLEKFRWYVSFDTDNAESVVMARLDSGPDALLQQLGL